MPLNSIPNDSPVILALPHAGTDMLRPIADRLADPSRLVTAPDRYIDRLVEDVLTDISYVRANFHRFQADVEHPDTAGNGVRTPGMEGVVPLLDRDGTDIWAMPPTAREAGRWKSMWYVPYHAILAAQIARVRAQHGHAVLVSLRALHGPADAETAADAPDLRISTHLGVACALDLSARLGALVRSWHDIRLSHDGRRGTGWSTRKHGRPRSGIHALDIEVSERLYLAAEGDVVGFDPARSAVLREVLAASFDFLKTWRPEKTAVFDPFRPR